MQYTFQTTLRSFTNKPIDNRIKIINQNVQGLKGQKKKKKVIEWAKRKNFDLMTMQEAHIEEQDLDNWRDVWKGGIIYSCGTNNSKGVVILIRENLEHEIIEEIADKEGRWIIATIQLKGVILTIANFYGPNDDDPSHLEKMIEELYRIKPSKLVVTGDFNLVLNINIDKQGGLPRTNFKSQKILKEWMEEDEITDIWRIKNPDKRIYTWISKTQHKVMSRLDFILISDTLQTNYLESNIVPGYMSDHACTTLTLRVPDGERGKGFWKYNSQLSSYPELKQQIEEVIEKTIEENQGIDDCLLWDLMKCKIRGVCIGLAAQKNRKKKEELWKIEKNIKVLEEEIQGYIQEGKEERMIETQHILEQYKTDRDKIISDKVEGDAIRCKISWHEEGHKASKMFLNLEKTKGESKTIRTLKDNNGKTVTGVKNILKLEEDFYKNIYKSKTGKQDHQTRENEAEIWKSSKNGPRLLENEHPYLTTTISEQELWEIIKTSPLKKSPGTDGFTTEFYQEFWPQIKKYLIKSLNTGLERGKLNQSQRRGIISLIPKPQKDLDLLKNWRPITLLNQDYKYLTKALANRIEKTLGEIISTDQSGFVKGRYIGCNIQRIQNTIELCKKLEKKGTLVNIDFEKAFDTIEWQFIYKSLEVLNFPEKLIQWIKSIYKDIETCVINNGNTSEYFYPERGVRQGCPISPYLFIITSEIMNRWIKEKMENMEIKGKNKENYLIAQFADDTSFAVQNEKKCLYLLFEHLDMFGKISGLKLNIDKTEILLLGNADMEKIPKRYRKYVKNEVNYLGCIINSDQKETTEININKAVNKLNNLLEKWKHRATTLSGKIAIIKSLLIPQVTYILTTMTSPGEEKIKTLERNLYKFLNSGGSEKIKRNILIGEYENGGYKMTDIASYIKAIKLNWVSRLLNIEGIWKNHLLDTINIIPEYFLRCNIKYQDLPFKKEINQLKLWDEILKFWCEENYEENIDTVEKIMNQSIWLNSNIKINKKVVMWKNWYEEGFKWIADLIIMEDNGDLRFMSYNEIQDFHIKNFNYMEYNSLMSSIPKTWKNQIKTETIEDEGEGEGELRLIDKITKEKKPMKYLYKVLRDKKTIKPTITIEKWRRDLNIETEEDEILNGHTKNHYSTINNRLRSFNCNFLNRNLSYNKRLKKMGKKPDELCAHCGKEETILHLYWECEERKKLWNKLKDIYETVTTEILDIDKEKCLLFPTKTKRDKKPETIRILFLLTKHFIHLMKCKEDKRPKEKDLELYIRNHLKTERQSSKGRGSERKFLESWDKWIPWIEYEE
jgi:exonuclease III